jgi:6-phosphofructokinase 1
VARAAPAGLACRHRAGPGSACATDRHPFDARDDAGCHSIHAIRTGRRRPGCACAYRCCAHPTPACGAGPPVASLTHAALVCLGGGGTIKNAYLLKQMGLNVITLPKTIDNDVAMTDITFGFDTALGIAVEAIDRLHSTAYSHHRIIVVEIMGHRAGWLALGAGISGGADVILIPEIPYDIDIVAESILKRVRNGSHFSIVAVAEGAISKKAAKRVKELKDKIEKADDKKERNRLKEELLVYRTANEGHSFEVAKQLEELTGVESRVTILGHLQRGGTPSAADRLLATRLGTACSDYIQKGIFGVMIAAKGDTTEPVLLEDVVGKRKVVPLDHAWIKSARAVGTCMGDE